ncbi:hypothetical protein AB7849_09280 [Rhodanobacter sp. 115]|uniref:hypothetical protein n=1 Tax=Rhodanobacter sp. FW021-MT20 TaxID=1162282 RepID=UPI0034E5B6C0
MLLDPYLAQVIDHCTNDRLLLAMQALYPEMDWSPTSKQWVLEELGKWRAKGSRKPGLALSTGRRNSFNGMATCALLDALQVDRPKAPRNRMTLAWAVLGSVEARHVIGHVDELETARAEREARYGPSWAV